MDTPVEKRVWLSPEQAQRLHDLAQRKQTSEQHIINQALDILFSSAFPSDAFVQHPEHVTLSRTSPSEDEFRQYLQSTGLLIADELLPTTAQEDRTPNVIKGKPLSETVLEERR